MVDIAIAVAGLAADPGLARRIAQGLRRGEGEVAERHEVRLAPARGLVMKQLARRHHRVFGQDAARRQDSGIAGARRAGTCQAEGQPGDRQAGDAARVIHLLR